MSDVTLYHNPRCSTSRSTLELIRGAGIEPTVIDYLKTPPTSAALQTLAQGLGGARALLRSKEALYAELDLQSPHWSDEQLIGFLQAHPILLNRPVVATPLGTRVCRPPETVLELLPRP